jgi:hypothetical protein
MADVIIPYEYVGVALFHIEIRHSFNVGGEIAVWSP